MKSNADIERGLIEKSVKLRCSSLSLSLALVAAAICILIPPTAAAASYTRAALGAEWALIQAQGTASPSNVYIGMFRLCYGSPGVACTPFQWGLDFDADIFQGADKWKEILPSPIFIQVWTALSAGAFLMTFMAAFCYCNCAPEQFIWIVGVLTALVDLTYFGMTAGLYFILQTHITASTEYTPKPVTSTLIVYTTTLVLLLLIIAIGTFIARETDTRDRDWKQFRRKQEEDAEEDEKSLTGHFFRTRQWVARKLAVRLMGRPPQCTRVMVAGGQQALIQHYGTNTWKNPYETEEELKQETEDISQHRAEHEEVEEAEHDIIEEAQVERQTADIEYARKREKLDKLRKGGELNSAEYMQRLAKLDRKRQKVKASKVQRANVAKMLGSISEGAAVVPVDEKKKLIMIQRGHLFAQLQAGRQLQPRQIEFLQRTANMATQPTAPLPPTQPGMLPYAHLPAWMQPKRPPQAVLPGYQTTATQPPLRQAAMSEPANPSKDTNKVSNQPSGPMDMLHPKMANPLPTKPVTSTPEPASIAAVDPDLDHTAVVGGAAIFASNHAPAGTALGGTDNNADRMVPAVGKLNKLGRPGLGGMGSVSATAGIQKHRKSMLPVKGKSARFGNFSRTGLNGQARGVAARKSILKPPTTRRDRIKPLVNVALGVTKDYAQAQGAVDPSVFDNHIKPAWQETTADIEKPLMPTLPKVSENLPVLAQSPEPRLAAAMLKPSIPRRPHMKRILPSLEASPPKAPPRHEEHLPAPPVQAAKTTASRPKLVAVPNLPLPPMPSLPAVLVQPTSISPETALGKSSGIVQVTAAVVTTNQEHDDDIHSPIPPSSQKEPTMDTVLLAWK